MLYEKIKADRLSAFKKKEDVKKNLLGVLVAECSKDTKTPDDNKVIATIKKFIKNIEETSAIPTVDVGTLAKLSNEHDILKAYLPSQLNEEGIRVAVNTAIVFGNKDVGSIMKYLKENYPNRIDMKVANKIVVESLKEIN